MAIAALIVIGRRSVASNWRARSASAVRSRSSVGSSDCHGAGRGDEQELVRAVAAGDDAVGQLLGDQSVNREQRLVARAVAVDVVEEPEVVDVDERDAERRPGRPWRARSIRRGGRRARRG